MGNNRLAKALAVDKYSGISLGHGKIGSLPG